jgi:hypothetical protein
MILFINVNYLYEDKNLFSRKKFLFYIKYVTVEFVDMNLFIIFILILNLYFINKLIK